MRADFAFIGFEIRAAHKAALIDDAKRRGISLSQLLRALIAQHLRQHTGHRLTNHRGSRKP